MIFWLLFVFAMSVFGIFFSIALNKFITNKNISILSGMGTGVMLATTIWSLLIPSFEHNGDKIVIILFFVLGFAILLILEIINERYDNETNSIITYLVVTAHNIPEGLIIGAAFGMANMTHNPIEAISIAVAIGVQNFPESIALTTMLKERGCSKKKNIILNIISAGVEPIAGIIGYISIYNIMNTMGITLSFTAGMMMYVIISEMLLENIKNNKALGLIGILLGFTLMMILENIL